jgi:hypothetical protein
MTVPTGASALTSDTTLAGLNWLYSWDVNCSLNDAADDFFIGTGLSVRYL